MKVWGSLWCRFVRPCSLRGIQPHQQLRRVGLLSVLTIGDLNLTGALVGSPRFAGLADRCVLKADLRRIEVGAVPDPVGRLGLLVEL